jgi:hypothetical protein
MQVSPETRSTRIPPKAQPRSSATGDLRRIEAVGRPWWAEAPRAFLAVGQVFLLPFRAAAATADAIVSFTFVAIIAAIAGVLTGYIPDATVANVLGVVGDRLLAILQSSGLL